MGHEVRGHGGAEPVEDCGKKDWRREGRGAYGAHANELA